MVLFGGNLLLQGKSFETLVFDFTETIKSLFPEAGRLGRNVEFALHVFGLCVSHRGVCPSLPPIGKLQG